MNLQKMEQASVSFMERWSEPSSRIALAIIFIWFGILKPFGLSSAAGLVMATVDWMPFFTPHQWVSIIGWWEVVIGVCFLFKRTTWIGLVLLALQITGTFMPMVLLPDVVYQAGRIPYGLTLVGQYIVKNLLVISTAMVIGARLKR